MNNFVNHQNFIEQSSFGGMGNGSSRKDERTFQILIRGYTGQKSKSFAEIANSPELLRLLRQALCPSAPNTDPA